MLLEAAFMKELVFIVMACCSDGFLWTFWKAFNTFKCRIILLQFERARWTGWHHDKKTRSSNRSAAVSSCHCRGEDARCTRVLQGLADFWDCKTFSPLIREASSVLTSPNRHTFQTCKCFVILKTWPSILFTTMMCWGKLKWSYFEINAWMFSSIHVVLEVWWRHFSGFLTELDNLCQAWNDPSGCLLASFLCPHFCWEHFQPHGSGFWWHPACSAVAGVCRKAGTGPRGLASYPRSDQQARAHPHTPMGELVAVHGADGGRECLWFSLSLQVAFWTATIKSCAFAKPFFYPLGNVSFVKNVGVSKGSKIKSTS